MSGYKVGDLASLFPTPPAKGSKNNLQSLFNEHWNKRKIPFSSRENKKPNKDFKNSESELASFPNKKFKDEKDSSLDNQLSQKRKRTETVEGSLIGAKKTKKQKKFQLQDSPSDKTSFEIIKKSELSNSNQYLKKHNKSVKGFIRSSKSKKQKRLDGNYETVMKSSDVEKHDQLFNESEESITVPHKQHGKISKKQKAQQSKNFQMENAEDFSPLNKKFKKSNRLEKNSVNLKESTSEIEPDLLFKESNKSTDPELKRFNKKQRSQKLNCPIGSTLDFIPLSNKNKLYHNATEDLSQGNVSKAKKEKKIDLNKDLDCTLFVGNLPMSADKKVLQKLFHPFGTLKTVRLRGAIPKKQGIPKKVAEIKNQYHKGVHSLKGFVVFKDRESAKAALSLNGTLFDNHHIVVDFATPAGEKKMYADSLSIFIGNLPFDVDDETVRSAFEECGEIQAVRVIRDKETGVGKGFGYIQFYEISAKEQALKMQNLEINGRNVRVKPVDNNSRQKKGSKDSLMKIRSNVAMKRTKESGSKKSVKKLLKKGRHLHQKKRIAHLFGEKFVK